MNLELLLAREQIIKDIRAFFDARGFHEVTVPVLNLSVPLEPNLHPFKTIWETTEGKIDLYLPLSPERHLKYLLAKGIGNCYAIGHTFRNLESAGPKHNPEFLMLEWYRMDATSQNIMKDTQTLMRALMGENFYYQGKTYDLSHPWPHLSLVDLFAQYAKLQFPKLLDEQQMRLAAKAKGYAIKKATWGELFDQIFLNEIEPYLPQEPFFLVDFPARMSPLCAPQKEKPFLADRFEVYFAGIELGNGNSESTNAESVRAIFRQESSRRSHPQPMDETFFAAIRKMENKQLAGIGLGVDRLAMIIANQTTLSCFQSV